MLLSLWFELGTPRQALRAAGCLTGMLVVRLREQRGAAIRVRGAERVWRQALARGVHSCRRGTRRGGRGRGPSQAPSVASMLRFASAVKTLAEAGKRPRMLP